MECSVCHGTERVCPVYGSESPAGNGGPHCSECIGERGIPCGSCGGEPQKMGGPFATDPDARGGQEDEWHH